MKYIGLIYVYFLLLVVVLISSSLIIAQPNNLERGDKFNIKVTAYQASIKINGSTLDLFHVLDAPFDSYVSDKGNIKVKSITDDSNGNTTVDVEGEFHGKQTVSGATPDRKSVV